MKRGSGSIAAAIALSLASNAFALDKQGSAHSGAIEGADSGFDFSGAASMGVSIYNPSYAARPDNTGLTLLRYVGHADVDLIGRRLSLPLDVNMFTDRLRAGARKLSPTEFDAIGGITTTWGLGPGAIEFGTRVEHDTQIAGATAAEVAAAHANLSPSCLEGGVCSQTYVDLRLRYLYSLAAISPALGDALGKGDVSGWFTLGYFAYNPTYAARPDNTDLAFFRYAVHSELSILDDLFSFGFDGTMFTSKQTNKIRPSELDFTPEVIVRRAPWELHLAYERDMPVDRSGLVQDFAYALLAWAFDLHDETHPLEDRGHIPSP